MIGFYFEKFFLIAVYFETIAGVKNKLGIVSLVSEIRLQQKAGYADIAISSFGTNSACYNCK